MEPCCGDGFVGELEPVGRAPRGVSRLGLFGDTGSAVAEHEPDVEIGMLGFDKQMLLPILGQKPALRFNDDPILKNEVRRILRLSSRLFILDLRLLIFEAVANGLQLIGNLVFQP